MTQRLSGDEELHSLLGSFGSIQRDKEVKKKSCDSQQEDSKPQKSKRRKKESSVKVDGRLSHQLKWPPYWTLGAGIAHDCVGFLDASVDTGRTLSFSTRCGRCRRASATHRLEGRGNMQSALRDLFRLSRDIRCAAGEYCAISCVDYSIDELEEVEHTSKRVNAFLGRAANELLRLATSLQKKHALTSSQAMPLDNVSLVEKIDNLLEYISAHRQVWISQKEPLSAATNHTFIRLLEARLNLIIAADELYYRCYYTVASSSTAPLAATGVDIPHPADYFAYPGLAWDAFQAGKRAQVQFLSQVGNHAHELRHLLFDEWELEDYDDNAVILMETRPINPLQRLWQARWRETVRHFWCSGWASIEHTESVVCNSSNSSVLGTALLARPGNMAPEFALQETLAPRVLAEWRDSVRDFPASLYAYATPTACALDAIVNILFPSNGTANSTSSVATDRDCVSMPKIDNTTQYPIPLVEVGAGMGYWAALIERALAERIFVLNRRKKVPKGQSPTFTEREERQGRIEVPVVAIDVSPPGGVSGGYNDYHGKNKSFVQVHQGDAEDAGTILTGILNNNGKASTDPPVYALMLCYPTPGEDMALRALRAFMRDASEARREDPYWFFHIGEWAGLTGSPAFEHELVKHFSIRLTF